MRGGRSVGSGEVGAARSGAVHGVHETIIAIVGVLAVVEVTSGILQGYYTPLYTDIAKHLGIRDADVNWFEAAQLLVSAVVVPTLARLADLVGHRAVLIASAGVTAVGAWGTVLAPNFWTYLFAWALTGAYVVWLPLEIAIVHRRTRGDAARTRVAASVLVLALEVGVIVGALGSGMLSQVLGVRGLLAIPALAVSLCCVAVRFGVPEQPAVDTGRFDLLGALWLAAGLVVAMGAMMLMRLRGVGFVPAWLTLVVGLGLLVALLRYEREREDALVDVELLTSRAQWPIQLTAALFGMSVLGAQIPLSTFARTEPKVAGYGLGVGAGGVSIIVGGYVLALGVGAVSLPRLAGRLGQRLTLAGGALAVGVGYGLFLVNHGSLAACAVNMVLAGVGSGLLVAALPASAAENAPANRTGQVAGLTNMSKTLGGAVASSVFALCLGSGGSVGDPELGHAPFSGYLAVWAVCAVSAVAAGVVMLMFLPRAEPVRTTPSRA